MWTWLSIRPGMAVAPAAPTTTSHAATRSDDNVPIAEIIPSSSRMSPPGLTGDFRSPVTMMPMLTIAVRKPSLLPQPILADDILGREAADPRIEPPPVGQADDERDLVGRGRVR